MNCYIYARVAVENLRKRFAKSDFSSGMSQTQYIQLRTEIVRDLNSIFLYSLASREC